MIFVTLGTQDKSFHRLLEAIDKEIENGTIKEKVIVQAGYTKYTSDNMEIFDLIAPDKFDEIIDNANLVITHGGAGSILTALKKGKTIIAAPRLKKYKEHTNDHQKEIIDEFVKDGYILGLYDFNKLGKVLSKAKNFKPKKFTSNTDNMIKLIEDYIEKDNHISWYNKCSFVFKYLIFFILYSFIFVLIKNNVIRRLDLDNSLIIFLLLLLLFISYFSSNYLVFKNKFHDMMEEVTKVIFYVILNFLIFVVCINFENNYLIFRMLF